MVSEAMPVQDKSGDTMACPVVPSTGLVLLDAEAASIEHAQLKEQYIFGDEFAPKARKPYTITKQRERWTEDEHKKFLEALKLYGRAWRRIEEHVATKTAVQIRSHAQKFFSKIVRESSCGDTNSVKPIEIPPPRPKRKPVHPYPRKLVAPVKTDISVPERPSRSISPTLNMSEQENQSPTSVLSGIGSDALGNENSSTPSRSPSPVSSADGVTSCGFGQSLEANLLSEERTAGEVNASPSPDSQKHSPVKLELFPQVNALTEEGLLETSSAPSLKLFGKTVLLGDPPPSGDKMQSADASNQISAHALPWNFLSLKFTPNDAEGAWVQSSCVTEKVHVTRSAYEGSRTMESVHFPSLPWGTFCTSLSFPCLQVKVQVHSPKPLKAQPLCNSNEIQDRELQKEGSSSGSNVDSGATEGEGEKTCCIEAQSRQLSHEKDRKEENTISHPIRSQSLKLDRRASSVRKGFVPYKRCLSDVNTQSSTITAEEREEQRVRLCL